MPSWSLRLQSDGLCKQEGDDINKAALKISKSKSQPVER
jgi:hypothetical protein